MSGELRAAMPLCAAFIDDLRAAFGQEDIDAVVRRGLHPACPPGLRFYAAENGQVLGCRGGVEGCVVSVADMFIAFPIK